MSINNQYPTSPVVTEFIIGNLPHSSYLSYTNIINMISELNIYFPRGYTDIHSMIEEVLISIIEDVNLSNGDKSMLYKDTFSTMCRDVLHNHGLMLEDDTTLQTSETILSILVMLCNLDTNQHQMVLDQLDVDDSETNIIISLLSEFTDDTISIETSIIDVYPSLLRNIGSKLESVSDVNTKIWEQLKKFIGYDMNFAKTRTYQMSVKDNRWYDPISDSELHSILEGYGRDNDDLYLIAYELTIALYSQQYTRLLRGDKVRVIDMVDSFNLENVSTITDVYKLDTILTSVRKMITVLGEIND